MGADPLAETAWTSARTTRVALLAGVAAAVALALAVLTGVVLRSTSSDGGTPGGLDLPAGGQVAPTPTWTPIARPTMARPSAASSAPGSPTRPPAAATSTLDGAASPTPTLASSSPPATLPTAAPTETPLIEPPTPTATTTSVPTAPPTATETPVLAGFSGLLIIVSALDEPIGFWVSGGTLSPAPDTVAEFVNSGAYEAQLRRLGDDLDPACDLVFRSMTGGGSYSASDGAIAGWFVLDIEIVSDGSGVCRQEYVPARIDFSGWIDVTGSGNGTMWNEQLTGEFPWYSYGS